MKTVAASRIWQALSRAGRSISVAADKIGKVLGMHKEDKAGLYITVIFHLVVLIIMLGGTLSSAIRGDSSYLIDFSRQEEEKRLAEEEEFKDEISKRLDRMLDGGDIRMPQQQEIRNIAVDASESSILKDDRNTDAEKLYADAARLQEELANGYRQDLAPEDMRNETVDLSAVQNQTDNAEKPVYKGPSVVSYTLDGRKASTLKIPAYRCIGGGEVTVIITVDNSGRVVNAKVMDDVSSGDECLRNFAVRAARLSRFSASPTAPHNQVGEIVYRFVAQ
ncbi:MAG: TonB family protein [Bacteroidetes bacterium]|uniref:TonB family protein n=1 Tax=Candidatus Cryptobacteroides merdavium TaxID=2840769 RepID=A0A9D9HCG1_9BACT|nr:TonB family protein [Candidatus Cryptobacteroides merdavium]